MYNVLNNPTGYYVIRNGRAFYKDTIARDKKHTVQILDVLVKRVKTLGLESVALPANIELAMPTSEKNFIGDIPLGSYVNCAEKNTMVGIYWRNEWGCRDLDLHVRTIDGQSLGWNVDYQREGNHPILFSGDMTNANPEATEIMWFKNQPEDSIVSVCEYAGDRKYHYQMFIAQEKATNFEWHYMVDPRNIIYRADISLEGKTNLTLGFFNNGKFVFHSCNIGNGLVPTEWRTKILKHLVQCSYLTIREVLELAGVKIDPESEYKISSKSDIINMFG